MKKIVLLLCAVFIVDPIIGSVTVVAEDYNRVENSGSVDESKSSLPVDNQNEDTGVETQDSPKEVQASQEINSSEAQVETEGEEEPELVPTPRVSYAWDTFNQADQSKMTRLLSDTFLPEWEKIIRALNKLTIGWGKGSSITVPVNSFPEVEAYSQDNRRAYIYNKHQSTEIFGFTHMTLPDSNFSITWERNGYHKITSIKITREREKDYNQQIALFGQVGMKNDSKVMYGQGGIGIGGSSSAYWYVYDDIQFEGLYSGIMHTTVTPYPPELKVESKNSKEVVDLGEQLKQPEEYIKVTQSMERNKTFKFTEKPDTSKVGTTTGTIEVTESTSDGYTQRALVDVNFEVKEDKTSIKTKDSTLYVGQKWNKTDNFVSATDEAGHAIPWEDSRITANGASVDTSKPGIYTLKYSFKGKLKTVDSEFKVTVKEDKTAIKTKDSTLYVGQTWNKTDNFVSATDEDGHAIPWEDSRITANGASVDTSKPGIYTLKYSFKGKLKTIDSEFKVTVKEDKTSLELKDVELYVGEPFDPNTPFKNVTDKDGNQLSAKDIQYYYIDDVITKELDTSKPGLHTIRLVYDNATGGYEYGGEATITVKENKWVNVTIPTEMVFFSDMNNSNSIISDEYTITNNSDNTALEVEMTAFSIDKSSEVHYLSELDKDPMNSEKSLRLHLFVGNEEKINSLNSNTKSTFLVDLTPKNSTDLKFKGKYFNTESAEPSRIENRMTLKFNIKE